MSREVIIANRTRKGIIREEKKNAGATLQK